MCISMVSFVVGLGYAYVNRVKDRKQEGAGIRGDRRDTSDMRLNAKRITESTRWLFGVSRKSGKGRKARRQR